MKAYGAKPALVRKDRVITYEELIQAVNGKSAPSKERIVFAELGNQLDNAVEILRILANGQIAIPLNPDYGTNYCDSIRNEVEQKKGIEMDADIALILFTSGSGGRPKGIMLSHTNIIANICAIEKYFTIDESDRILIARPLMHAAVLIGELFVALSGGLTIHFYGESFVPQRLRSYIDAHGITTFCATPTLMNLICKASAKRAKSSLRKIAVSGEVLPVEAAERISDTFPDCDIYSVYGLTEASPRVSYLPPSRFSRKPGSVGIPIDGVDMRLVHENGIEIFGQGEGRLWIRSAGVMRGYFGETCLTQCKIIDGWLETGDIARRDADGDFYIVGRADEMIIRGGMNIYPETVEIALKSDARVHNAVCYGILDSIFGQAVCVAVEGEVTEPDVLEIAKAKLPSFMLPTKIHLLKDFPLTASGKVNRYAIKNGLYG